jgi:hypothetical protein
MKDARPIGELIRGVLARCEAMMGFQAMLDACECATDRKTLIMQARERGAIAGDEAALLIQVYQLETA